jgi:hypothetical protein
MDTKAAKKIYSLSKISPFHCDSEITPFLT